MRRFLIPSVLIQSLGITLRSCETWCYCGWQAEAPAPLCVPHYPRPRRSAVCARAVPGWRAYAANGSVRFPGRIPGPCAAACCGGCPTACWPPTGCLCCARAPLRSCSVPGARPHPREKRHRSTVEPPNRPTRFSFFVLARLGRWHVPLRVCPCLLDLPVCLAKTFFEL